MAEEDPIEEVIHADEVERAQDEEYIDMDAVRRMLRRSQRQSQMFIIDTLTEFDLEYLDRMLADLPLKWNHLMPCTVAEIFCNAPRHLLDQTWNKLERGNPRYLVHCNVDSTLSEWRPSQFEDAENRLYESFCPAIMCMKSNTFRFVAYKSAKFSATHNNKKKWFTFPSLAYLPTDVMKVVAGDGGLLVCDGGIQPRRPPIKGEKLLPLTHDEEDDYDREVFPEGQSVMLVTNPVTREYYFLPPIPHIILQDKCACLVLVPHDGHSFNMKRNRTASFLAKRRSSASLLLENFESYSHDPNEYYPPGLRPEFYTKGSSFRGSRVWQHNGSTRFSFLQPKVQPTEEDDQLSPKIPTPLLKTPQPRRTIHGSAGDTPGSQREVERIEALVATDHDIHKKSQVVVEDDVSSTTTEEIELDPYKNRLEEYCHHYMVVVMGSHHDCATESTKNVEEIVCAVFRSKEKNEGWFLRTVPFKARLMPPEHGRTGLAFIKNGSWMAVCFGGLLVEELLEEVPPRPPPEECDISEDDNDEKSIATSKSSKSSNNSHDSIFCPADPNKKMKPPNANPPTEEMEECPVVAKKKLWCEDTSEETSSSTTSEEPRPPPTPQPEYLLIETVTAVLFVVPIVHEDDSAVAFSFNPLRTEEDGYLQSPIVVQPFGWQSPMPMLYAVTRKTVQADTIMVFAIGFDVAGGGNPVPSGHFMHVTDMPTPIFNDIFETIDYSQKEFECTAGNGLICIRVKDFRVLAIYDIQKRTWLRQDYSKYMPTQARARPYQMFENCVYEPNFWQKCDYNDMDTNELPLHLCGPYEG